MRKHLSILLLLLPVFVACGGIIVANLPYTLSQTEANGAKIYFNASHRLVLFQSCITVGWEVDGIKAVYLNGEGRIGKDTQEVCASSGDYSITPTLTLILQDSSTKNYELPVAILFTHPRDFLFALLFLAPCWFFAGYIGTISWLPSRRFMQWLGTLSAVPHLPNGSRSAVLTRIILVPVIFALTMLPILAVVNKIATEGAENVSNDAIIWTKLVATAANGTYDWRNYLKDTVQASTHSMAIPNLIYIGLAKWANWNLYLALYLGVGLAALRLVLLHSALTYKVRHWLSWWMWPCLSAFIFAPTQIDMFGYMDTTLQYNLVLLGLALGLWGITRFPRQWMGVGLASLGGFLAAWSGGAGIVTWPIFLVFMVLRGFRRIGHYFLWFCVGLVAALPYLITWLSTGLSSSIRTDSGINLLRFDFVWGLIGLPFSKLATPNPAIVALALMFFVSGCGLLLMKQFKRDWLRLTPILILMSYGVLTVWQTSVARSGLAPWYTPTSFILWTSFVGLGYLFLTSVPVYNVQRLWSMTFIGFVAFIYALSNLVEFDPSFVYLWKSRRPVSASCVRYYLSAPTYCEGYVFQWGIGNPELLTTLASPLAPAHLSVFAPQQRWTLQGDFGLDNVRTNQRATSPILWTADQSLRPVAWDDIRHLNLWLEAPNEIQWRVKLPPTVRGATFQSAIVISESVPANEATFQVFIQAEGEEKRVFEQRLTSSERQWQPLILSLDSYAGQQITLRLTSIQGKGALFRYPTIDLVLDPAQDTAPLLDLKMLAPRPTSADWVIGTWAPQDLIAISSERWQVSGARPELDSREVNVLLGNYSDFFLRIRVPQKISPERQRFMQIILTVEVAGTTLYPSVLIPLWNDGDFHDYHYPLRLFELDRSAILTRIRWFPIATAEPGSIFDISTVRLIRRED